MTKQADRWGKMPLTVASDPALPATAKLVFSLLAMCHNEETKQCNPSQSQLAEYAGTSRSSIQRSVQALTEHGYVKQQSIKGRRSEYLLFQEPEHDPNPVTSNSFDMTRIGSSPDPNPVRGCPESGQPYNELKEKEKKTKRVPPSVDTNFADMHKKLRPVWTRITKAKYPGGELVRLARQHSEDAVIDALEQISHRPEPPRKVIPYLVTMLRDAPAPKAAPEPPADPEEYDHNYESLFTTHMKNRPGGIMAIPTWGEG